MVVSAPIALGRADVSPGWGCDSIGFIWVAMLGQGPEPPLHAGRSTTWCARSIVFFSSATHRCLWRRFRRVRRARGRARGRAWLALQTRLGGVATSRGSRQRVSASAGAVVRGNSPGYIVSCDSTTPPPYANVARSPPQPPSGVETTGLNPPTEVALHPGEPAIRFHGETALDVEGHEHRVRLRAETEVKVHGGEHRVRLWRAAAGPKKNVAVASR